MKRHWPINNCSIDAPAEDGKPGDIGICAMMCRPLRHWCCTCSHKSIVLSNLLIVPTNKSVSEAATALQAAVEANHFGVMQIHNLKETMTKKGVDFPQECLIFEVCQPQQAKKVLDQNMSVSTALPCRISIYEKKGKTILAAVKPTTLLATFNTPELEGVAQEVEDAMLKIMNEAA